MNDILFVFKQNPLHLDPASKPTDLRVILHAILVIVITRFIFTIAFSIDQTTGLHLISDIIQAEKMIPTPDTVTHFVLIVVIVGPITEEVSFRGFLTQDRRLLILSIAFFAVSVLNMVYQVMPYEFPTKYNFMINAGRLSLAAIIYFILTPYATAILAYVSRNIKWLLPTSMVFFAFIHFFNYDLSVLRPVHLFFSPFIFLLYYSLAVAFTYIRIRSGLIWSIVFHMSYNAIATLTLLYR